MSVVTPPSVPPISIQCAMQQAKPDQLALVEDRQGQGDVIEVAAGGVGVVGDEDVAGLHVLDAEMLDLGLDRLGHAADEHRQPEADRHGLALGREQPGGEIERLVDDHVVGGAHEVGLHFLGHGDDAVAHDLGHDRIGLAGGRFERCHCLTTASLQPVFYAQSIHAGRTRARCP